MHCVLSHFTRLDGRNPRRWNQAGDFVINLILVEAGFTPVPNWLYDTQYEGMTTEQVYALLSEDDGRGKSKGDSKGDPLDEVMPPGHGDSSESGGGGGESCAGGSPGHADPAAPADPAGAVQADWRSAVEHAARSHVGTLSGALKRFVDALLTPKVDWKSVLQQFVTSRARNDYSWMRPNRRRSGAGVALPGMYSEDLGTVVVAIDTSGSIDDATLAVFASEVTAIVEMAKPQKLVVIYCDCKVQHVDEFMPYDLLHFELHGGGGTSFLPPFAYVDEHQIDPECLIYLTDGEGPFPDAAPYPVLWCCTTDVVAPFGQTLPIRV
jgi:predicted metal-dependent peptidase